MDKKIQIEKQAPFIYSIQMISKQNDLPDYKQIYMDILNKKYQHKKKECQILLEKTNLSVIDIIKLNQKIFGQTKETKRFNQRHRSYNESDVIEILKYQKAYNLNNSQLASYFKLSRNTVAKWRKMFGLSESNYKCRDGN